MFLLVALSAASVVSVLKLSGDGASVNGRPNGNVPKVVYNVEETIVDPIVGSDAKISVVSSKNADADSQPAVDMEAVGDELLANERVDGNVDLVLDDLEIGDDSAAEFVSVAATRDVEKDEPIALDDSDVEIKIEDGILATDVDEPGVVSSAALESPQDDVHAEGFDASDDGVVFEENGESDAENESSIVADEPEEDDLVSIFDEESETLEASAEDSTEKTAEAISNVNESFVVALDGAADDEIVFDSNDVDEELDELNETFFDDEDVVEEVEEEELTVADADGEEETEIAFESTPFAEDTSEALVDANDAVEDVDGEETVVADTDVEESEIEIETDGLVEEANETAEEVVEEETIAAVTSDPTEDDDLGDFLTALEANDVQDEIVFDDNEVEDEIVFDDNEVVDEDLSSIFDADAEQEEDLVLEANDDEADSEESDSADVVEETVEASSEEAVGKTDPNTGKVFFKAKTDEKTTSSLPNIDALEREAEFFADSSALDASVDESADANVQSSKTELLESVKTDDAYTSQILYDSDDDAKEESQEAAPSEETAPATDAVEESEETDSEQEETNVPADPCGPVVLCLSVEGNANVDESAHEQSVKESSNEDARYQKAPTTIHVSSQMVAEPEVATPAPAPVDDELWIVTQRGSFWRLENGSWSRKESKSFFWEDDPRRVTLFWAHGYQTDMGSASRSGFNLKAVVDAARAVTGIDRKYRIVIWKWESERNNNRLRLDAMEKKNLAYYSGVELGKLVGRLNPKDDVVFMGFSFGAVVTGAALQTLATTSNGYMTGHKKPAFATSGTESEKEIASGRISLILVSAACDLGAFNQGGMFRSGALLPSRVLNVYNPNDYALKFYPLISGTSQAVGIAPLMGNEFMNAVGETYNLNANSYLGKEHSFDDAIQFISSTTLSDMIF